MLKKVVGMLKKVVGMLKKVVGTIIITIIITYVASRCMDEVVYEYYLSRGDKLQAWLTRPIYGFKMYWIDRNGLIEIERRKPNNGKKYKRDCP